MEILNLVLILVLAGLVLYQLIQTRRLQKKIVNHVSSMNNLRFRYNEIEVYLEDHIAKIYLDNMERFHKLKIRGETSLTDAVAHPGVRDILIAQKIIQAKETGPWDESLAQRAGIRKVPLAPLLVDLNDPEVTS